MHDIAKRLPHLPECVLNNTVTTFRDTLRPIPDTPANRAACEAAAIDAFVALNPAHAADAALAQMIVIAEFTAAWSEQRVTLPDITPDLARRFTKQANSMLKFARSARRMLSKSKPPPLSPAAPTPSEQRSAAAKAERAARIRALDLRLIKTPTTMH